MYLPLKALLLSNVSQKGRCVFNINDLRLLNATSGKGRDVATKPMLFYTVVDDLDIIILLHLYTS